MIEQWVFEAYDLRIVQKKPWKEIITLFRRKFPELDDLAIYEKVRKAIKKVKQEDYTSENNTDENIEKSAETIERVAEKSVDYLKLLQTKGIRYADVQNNREIMDKILELSEQGYCIELDETSDYYRISKVVCEHEPNIVTKQWDNEEIIRFGLVSDTHLNSKYTQITLLHKFYDICADRGITEVYNCGDIDEGEEMRVGHKYECYKQGADEHIDEIVRVYPRRKGITTYFITGNHDASIIKRCGYDIGYAIQAKRDDMKYLGQSCAKVYFTPKCDLELRHPGDGTAYSVSYKMQKMIESMAECDKPKILAIGHYHKASYLFYRGVHAFYPGAFQSDTPFTKSKSISVHMGGWIIEARVGKDTGEIKSIKQEFIPFIKGIKDDYLAWKDFDPNEGKYDEES